MLLIAAGLRTYSAVTEAIEIDELFTRDVTSATIRAGAAMVLGDTHHPPLHYTAAKLLGVISGTNPEGLRLVSVLSGIGLVASAAFLTRALLADAALALLAALLVALSDWQILVSHYARSYSLFDLLVLLAAISLWKACCQPLETKFWVWFAMAGAAAVYTSYLAWLYLVCVLPAVALCGRRVLRSWLISLGAIVVSFLPWVLLLTWYARKHGGLAQGLASLDFHPKSGALVNAFAQFNGLPAQVSWALVLTLVVGGLLVAGAAVVAFRRLPDAGLAPRSVGVLIMGSLAVIPPTVLWFITRPPVNLPLWGVRQLTPSIAPWIVTVCAGLALMRGRVVLQAAVAATLVALQGVATVTNTVHSRFLPFHRMARLIAAKPADGGVVYLVGDPPWWALLRYYLPASGSVKTLPEADSSLPRSFWLVFRPTDGGETSRVAGLLARGWSPVAQQDFEKRGGERGVLRAVLLSRPGPAAGTAAGSGG